MAAPTGATPQSPRPTVAQADRPVPAHAGLPIVLVLDRLRSAYNVGNIYRLAECCGVRTIWSCGYTAAPPHPKLAKTARGCEQVLAVEQRPTCRQAVAELQAAGYQVIAVETVAGAPAPWEQRFAFPCALVLGNEALGIEPEALAACDRHLRLPVFGHKNSLNVSNTAAAVVYFAVQQWLASPAGTGQHLCDVGNPGSSDC